MLSMIQLQIMIYIQQINTDIERYIEPLDIESVTNCH